MKTFRAKTLFIISSVIFLSILFNGIKSYALYEKRIVIVSGEGAPGTDGALFSSTLRPWPVAISNTGRVIFYAYLENDGTGYWIEENEEVTLLIRGGNEIPFLPGQIASRIKKVYMDLSGQIGVDIEYSPTGEEPYTHGFFMEDDGDMVLSVYDGMPVSAGVSLNQFTVYSFNAGRVVFLGILEGEDVHTGNSEVIAMFGPEGFRILSREGDPMTDIAGDYLNSTYASYNSENSLDGMGNTIFQVKGFDQDTRDEIGATYFWSPSDGPSKIIDSGTDPASSAFGAWRLNASGTILNKGTFENGFSIRKNGDFQKVVSIGDIADGADGATFTSFNYFVLHNTEMVSVSAATSDGMTGIWTGDETGLKKIIRVGDQVPGLEDEMVFDGIFSRIAVNAGGQVAFHDWAIDAESELWGLWVGNLDGLELVTIMDEEIEVAPGDIRTVEATWLFSDFHDGARTGADGHPTIFNDNGELAFGLTFNEGGNAFAVASSGLVVNSTDDDEDIDPGDGICECDGPEIEGKPKCTLRAAIMEANAKEGKDKITFDIPIEEEIHFIALSGELPPMTDPVTVTGSLNDQQKPDIFLDGDNLIDSDGLSITFDGTGSSIQNLIIMHFDNGIHIDGSWNNTVSGCYIGTDTEAGDVAGNHIGIMITDGNGNTIGGLVREQGNYISGNGGDGLVITGTGSKFNKVLNNVIGPRVNMVENPGNGGNGLRIEKGATKNTVSDNVISGNLEHGIYISGSSTDNTGENMISKNYIGTDFDVSLDISNALNGILIENSGGNSVGGAPDGGEIGGNIISGNRGHGIEIKGVLSSANSLKGNRIGIYDPETGAQANDGDGIFINSAPRNRIGILELSPGEGLGNQVSLNKGSGIRIEGEDATGNMIEGNLLEGNEYGVKIINAPENSVGYESTGPNNVINLHEKDGIYISGSEAINNTVHYNYIGTDEAGLGEMRNKHNGVHITNGASLNGIHQNLISGNGANGIFISGDSENDTQGNSINDNRIGTNFDGDNPIPNEKNGIHIFNSHSNRISSVNNGAFPGNIISGNQENGVLIEGTASTLSQIFNAYIGTVTGGTEALPNEKNGIKILNSSGNIIGINAAPGSIGGNLISGNGENGIEIEGPASENYINGNLIGTDREGTNPLRNEQNGILLINAWDNTLGELPGNNLISGNGENGIYIIGNGSRGNTIGGNMIGVDFDGENQLANEEHGIKIEFADENVIGGFTGIAHNVISGNKKSGILLTQSANLNSIVGNLIGSNITGDEAIFMSPGAVGIEINDSFNNTIGFMEDRFIGNLISGNYFGIKISNKRFDGDNRIKHNMIGTDLTSEKDVGNFHGISIHQSNNNVIGGSNSEDRNVISFNDYGIYIDESSDNTILGNMIGTNKNGDNPKENEWGIFIHNRSKMNVIGGSSENEGNTISGNDIGIEIRGRQAENNKILGNKIGTDKHGGFSVGNGTGIVFSETSNNQVGGYEDNDRNIISGNTVEGVLLNQSYGSKLIGNLIGTNGDRIDLHNGIGIRICGGSFLIGETSSTLSTRYLPNLIAFNDIGILLDLNYNIGRALYILSNNIFENNVGMEIHQEWQHFTPSRIEFVNILGNHVHHNQKGLIIKSFVLKLDATNKIIIENNNFENNLSDMSGIHLDNTYAVIRGNQITGDAGSALYFENSANADISDNNIYGNEGYGLKNMSPEITVSAGNNWWGDASGPGGEGPGSGDEVSAGVDFASWRTEMVSLVLSTGADTVYIPSGETDSAFIAVRNWQHPTETVEVSATDDLGWVQEPTTFTVTLEERFGGGAAIYLSVPGGTETGTMDDVIVTAVSQTDPGTIESDSFSVLVYGPVLRQIFVVPDSVLLSPGDTVRFEATGLDQFHLNLDFMPVWSATGGTIDETGLYTAGEVGGVYVVTATDATGVVQGYAHVEIQWGVGVEGDEEKSDHQIPTEFHLSQNYPNPFNPVTTIEYALPEAANVRIEIYNIMGQVVAVLIHSNQTAGFHSIQWNASGVTSGVYFYRLDTGEFQSIKRMLLLK
ncbi:MAG: right-handed parallel beta-helix repeat-containing protein [Gemmatimonadota bacterium]|nr:MAG: right-handed parallel beta-helix repeat-containing protein [Gemmatimonadota bacterium]